MTIKNNKHLLMKKIILFAIIAVGFVACTSQKTNKGTATKTPIKTTTPANENMAQGKVLFENNCGKCHDLPTVEKFNDEKWKSIVDWMAPKAKLTSQQADMVYLYVSNSN